MTVFIGIDGGVNGGLAAYDSDTAALEVVRMPTVTVLRGTTNRQEYDLPQILAWFRNVWFYPQKTVGMVVLEKAQAFTKQGVVSMFTTGRCFGMMEGMLATLALPYTIIAPKTWQKRMFEGLAQGDPKANSILVAKRTFPGQDFTRGGKSVKAQDGMTDAALMAYWCFLTYK
jgi:hypothetical protein